MERWWWVSLCVYLYVHVMVSECVRVWVSDVSVVCVSKGFESEWSEWSDWSEWSEWSEVDWSGVEWSDVMWGGVEWSEVSDWVSVRRKRGRDPRDAGLHPTPWQCRRSPKGRQGVHQTAWQCILSHACHVKRSGAPRDVRAYIRPPWQCILSHACHGAPRDARAYIWPLEVHIVPRLPLKRGRAPRDASQGVHLTPWQCTSSHACHAKAGEPQGTPGRTSDPLAVDAKRRSPPGRQGVYQTPWQNRLSHACHAKKAVPQSTPGHRSDPLSMYIVWRLPYKKGRAPRGAYIRPLAVHIVPRLPRKRDGAPIDARAYIRPLTVHIFPRLPRKRGKARRDARTYIWSLGNVRCHACHVKSGGAPRDKAYIW